MFEKCGFIFATTRYIFTKMIMKLFFGIDKFKYIDKLGKVRF
jgi:hypothetical protein